MKRIIGYVNTADLNHMREEDVRALTVINIAFGLIRDGEVVWDAKDARGPAFYSRVLRLRGRDEKAGAACRCGL